MSNGLFTCTSLLRRLPESRIDVFDASPVPYGLVRYGVAPDHQDVKNCINIFDRMFESNRDRLSLFCNVRIGSDIGMNELTKHYDAILLAYGAHRPRQLEIPGSRSRNVVSGSDFVSWYNGVPNAKAPSLDDPNVVIVGNGNVALDCARILSNVDSLRTTDVPSDVLAALEKSAVTNIKIIGRRGPKDVSFTIKELREQFKVPKWDTTVEMDEEELAGLKDTLATMERRKQRLMKVGRLGNYRRCKTPSRRQAVSIHELSNSGRSSDFIHIGYQTVVLDGVPKNDKGMIAMKDSCRVDMPCGSSVYAAGWCAHGPRGVIVDTQRDAVAVADQMVKDIKSKDSVTGSLPGVQSVLDARRVKYVTWDEWKKIDDVEVKQGAEKGKVREKLTRFNGYLKSRSDGTTP
ncbi:unnamed protein product [Nippostrongylus brasiliensis]|uniref:NADPH:adrenodoxin oxidoreductase, mitochondrial n=1 Tax=Nippostrongylus brasiliensis TaxID=27835 RepID=A0A0N4Y5E2_NIPBR|nr:unnamed protein product [Nippostrongylus brasiliensis]